MLGSKIMVDSIKGHGDKTIIITKSRPKNGTDKTKQGDFDSALKDKSGVEDAAIAQKSRSLQETNRVILDRQQMARMQRLEDITRQIQAGTYKMADPEVLAERLIEIFTNKKLKDKFLKKLLAEETEGPSRKGQKLSDLELKKLIYLVKNSTDATFDDPQLEALLKELV